MGAQTKSGRAAKYALGQNPKARLGLRRARAWHLVPFANPARADDLQLLHWKREDHLGDPYPFARFNKAVNCPSYTDVPTPLPETSHLEREGEGTLQEEYAKLLTSPNWTKEETDHLIDLANRFDLR